MATIRKTEPTRVTRLKANGQHPVAQCSWEVEKGSKMAPNQAGLLMKEQAHREVRRSVGVCPKDHRAKVVIVMTL